MNVSSINSVADARRLLASEMSQAGQTNSAASAEQGSTAERAKQAGVAAKQFEAIILRQMLTPAIEPLMTNGIDGNKSGGSGGGVYSYLLTDVMANCLSQGGGMGLSKILQQQLMPKGSTTDAAHAAAAYAQWKGDKS